MAKREPLLPHLPMKFEDALSAFLKPEEVIVLTLEMEDQLAKSAGVKPGPGLYGRARE